MKVITIMLVVVGVVLTGTGWAAGATFTFQPSIGVWDDTENWLDEFNQTGVPGTGDTAIIAVNRICRVDSVTEEVDTLTVTVNSELRIEGSATLEVHTSFDVAASSTLAIEDTGVLQLNGDGETSTLDGELLFVKGGTGCTCDPASAPSPGVLNVTANHTITGSGTVSGGCDDDFDPCLNPGLISGATGVTLTLDPGTEPMRFNEYLHFAVPLDIQSRVNFRLTVAHQVLEFDGQVDGPSDITFYQGTVKVNACMRLTGPAGKFDFGYVTGGTDLPELIINARTCTEAPFAFDNGTLEANANFRVKSSIFSIGSLCFADPEEEGGNCLSNGDVVFEVAPNRNVVFDGTDGTCPACP